MYTLPRSLMTFLLTSPTWAALEAATGSSITPVDHFYHIKAHFQAQPVEPVCCLRPPETQEPAAELLSFEEWKEKQRLVQVQEEKPLRTGPDGNVSAEAMVDTSPGDNSSDIDHVPMTKAHEPAPHYMQVPLTNRFNYASSECSARIHASHSTARSSSSVLSSKKDKYMLTPCATQDKFIVVELCDDIRIDTVQLANFEFFSGVFKDIKISFRETYTSDAEGWTEMGTYEAANVRRIQTFHPLTKTALGPFVRYIRIDFTSHYGNEYYCPVSLLRVYGLTQMEEWKWDLWEVEWQKRAAEKATMAEATVAEPWPVASQIQIQDSTVDVVSEALTTSQQSLADDAWSSTTHPVPLPVKTTVHVGRAGKEPAKLSEASKSTPTASSSASDVTVSSKDKKSSSEMPSTPQSQPSSAPSQVPESHNPPTVSTSSPSTLANGSASLSLTHTDPSPSTTPLLITSQPSTGHGTGESVFRTIINRIALLEQNSTLYMRYVEEQTRSVRDAIRKLEEDVGRLEGISKTQTNAFNRVMSELLQQRATLEIEHVEMVARVNSLANEIILEKRLGIAQLVLLVTVLVFLSLTRGAGQSLVQGLRSRRRVLSFTGRRSEWRGWRRSLGASLDDSLSIELPRKGEHMRKDSQESEDSLDAVPTADFLSPRPPSPLQPPAPITLHPQQSFKPFPLRPSTPTFSALPLIEARDTTGKRPRFFQRSSSHNGPIPLSLSPAKSMLVQGQRTPGLAKTAHLHELKRRGRDSPRRTIPLGNRTNQSEREGERAHSPSPFGHPRRRRASSKLTPRATEVTLKTEAQLPARSPSFTLMRHTLEPESELDAWVDTDYATEDGEEQMQELEFPRIPAITRRGPLSAPPPTRRDQLSPTIASIPTGCLKLPETL